LNEFVHYLSIPFPCDVFWREDVLWEMEDGDECTQYFNVSLFKKRKEKESEVKKEKIKKKCWYLICNVMMYIHLCFSVNVQCSIHDQDPPTIFIEIDLE